MGSVGSGETKPPLKSPQEWRNDGGYSATELLVAMSVMVLAGALAVAIVTASTQATATIRNQAGGSLQAAQAIDRMASALGSAEIYSVTNARIVAFVNRPFRCFRYTYSIDWNSGEPALIQTIDARAVGEDGRCNDLAPDMWANPPIPADVSTSTTILLENLTPNSDGEPAFTYFSVGNSQLAASTLSVCEIARIGFAFTVQTGNGTTAFAEGSTGLNQTALAMGGC